MPEESTPHYNVLGLIYPDFHDQEFLWVEWKEAVQWCLSEDEAVWEGLQLLAQS